MSGLLDGVRVLDLSRVLAGPFAAQALAEMGADVVKVEFPSGDPARAVGPYQRGRSLYFSSVNTGKRGVLLDPRTEDGRAALFALLQAADVVVENFRPAAAAALGLTARDLLERFPSLVVVTVCGYSRDTDRGDEAAYDVSIQAEAGILSVTGEPGGPPVRAGVPVSDLAAGLWAAMGAVSGLVARSRDRAGRHIEVPLLDSTLPLLSYMATAAVFQGADPPQVGSGHHAIVPYGAFAAADGWVVIAVLADKFWAPMCQALALDELGQRADLATNAGRVAVRDEVDAAVGAAVARTTLADVLGRLEAAGVPYARVNSLLEALTTPYVAQRGLVAEVATAEGRYAVARGPLHDGAPPRPAPALGEHTAEVLAEWTGVMAEKERT